MCMSVSTILSTVTGSSLFFLCDSPHVRGERLRCNALLPEEANICRSPPGLHFYRGETRYIYETRSARRARVGTDRLPVVAPRPFAIAQARSGTALSTHVFSPYQ